MLSLSQQQAYDYLSSLVPENHLTALVSSQGCGLSTVLEAMARKLNGHILRLSDFFDHFENLHPLQIEEGIAHTLIKALQDNDCVLVDDFSSILDLINNCYYSARPKVLEPALDTILRLVEQENKRVILGLWYTQLPLPLSGVCKMAQVPAFTPEDFSFLFQRISGENLEHLDFEKVHRFAPRLSANLMKRACGYLTEVDYKDTDTFLKFLEKRALVSNVDTSEVEKVSFDSLRGVDEVIRQLEINIINPLVRDDLVKKYGLTPKRGVLLYGPPGTGKTTIGRALAHRLHSKFFLIDGTVISGTSDFYRIIQHTFHRARDNSPSVLFIDDCDLLFENSAEPGLYRYLLTMLDGLESKSNAQITIVLTAMNIGSLPPALIRSGRVELWLEMNLPDEIARAAIIRSHVQSLPMSLTAEEIQRLAEKTDQLTGADLRRIVTDAKNLYGYDIAQENKPQGFFFYFDEAIEQLFKHREQLEKAPAFTAAHHPKAELRHWTE